MKRYILHRIYATVLIAIFGLAATPLKAQFRYGPTAGVDFTNLHFNQKLFNTDRSVGFTGGIMAEMIFPGVGFGIDFGLQYNQRGATVDLGQKPLWNWLGYSSPRSYLHYLEIPIHLRFKYTRLGGLEDYIAPLAYVGPSFSFLVANSSLKAFTYNHAEVGIDFAIGAEVYRRLQVSGGYTLGVTDALNTRILTDCTARNRSWWVRAAWLF